ncbi:MAG: polysaccharide deacetylase family protein [Bacillota bacterium]
MYLPGGLSSVYLVGRFGVVILAVGLVLASTGGITEENPGAMLTFSFYNADESVIENAHPVLTEYNYTADVFIATSTIGEEEGLTPEDIEALYKAGWGIGSHGVSYRDLTEADPDTISTELTSSKRYLEEIVPEVSQFAAPHGEVDQDIINDISKHYQANLIRKEEEAVNELPFADEQIYNLQTLDIEELTLAEAKEKIGQVGENEWLVISLEGVGADHNWSQEDFTRLIEYVNEQDFEGVDRNNLASQELDI